MPQCPYGDLCSGCDVDGVCAHAPGWVPPPAVQHVYRRSSTAFQLGIALLATAVVVALLVR